MLQFTDPLDDIRKKRLDELVQQSRSQGSTKPGTSAPVVSCPFVTQQYHTAFSGLLQATIPCRCVSSLHALLHCKGGGGELRPIKGL